MEDTESRRFIGFDILKFLCAFLIVCIHCPFPGVAGEYFTALTRIAVPIFFMITGFFYKDVAERKNEKKQLVKILRLLIISNLIYLIYRCLIAAVGGEGVGAYLSRAITLKSIVKFAVLNESPFNGHLWYLGGILYVLLIAFAADKLGIRKVLFALTPFLLAGDLILGKYSLVLFHREFPYVIVRNFLFVGLPYFCIGELIRDGKINIKFSAAKLAIIAAVFSFTTLLERFLLVSNGMNAARDHYISTTFLAAAVFLLFIEIYNSRSANNVERWAARVGRDCSAWVYVIHPIFIAVIAAVMRKCGVYNIYQYIAPIVIYAVSIAFVMAVTGLFGKLGTAKKLKANNREVENT